MAYFVAFKPLFSLAFAITLSYFWMHIFASIDADNGGFSVELIHRDSPKSPFYNPQESPTQRLANAFRRSLDRVQHFYPTNTSISVNEPETRLFTNGGEYIMKISIGTPPFDILGIADTGGDLTWTQCTPCNDCYKQDAPLFDPKSSSTYSNLSCSTMQCKNLGNDSFCSSDGFCQYSYSYGDGSFTNGTLAVDTITLGSTNGTPVSFPNIAFGCGYNNKGLFRETDSGIIGLGGGSFSLITQLSSSIGGKFSYCFVPLSSTSVNSSTFNFGSKAVVEGEGTVCTPLVSKAPATYYYVTLEAISVGDRRIEFRGSYVNSIEGDIIIDSGTMFTYLPVKFYNDLASEVEKLAGGQRANDPNQILQLCYRADSNPNFPTITAHFRGADVKLDPPNAFFHVSEDVVCFAFVAADTQDIGGIYGYVAQANFLVAYDLERKTVSFKPTDCTKF